MKLVNVAGVTLNKVNLTALGSDGSYETSFTPPQAPFFLQLSGQTKQGFTFERLSHNKIKARPALLRVFQGRDDLKLQFGNKSYLIFKLYNVGPDQNFDFHMRDNRGLFSPVHKVEKKVRRNTQRLIYMSLIPTKGRYEKGKEDTLMASVRRSHEELILATSLTMLMTLD